MAIWGDLGLLQRYAAHGKSGHGS